MFAGLSFPMNESRNVSGKPHNPLKSAKKKTPKNPVFFHKQCSFSLNKNKCNINTKKRQYRIWGREGKV